MSVRILNNKQIHKKSNSVNPSLLSIYLTNDKNGNNINNNKNKIDELITDNINLLQNNNSKNEQIEKYKNELTEKNNEIEDFKIILKNKNIDFINEKNKLINTFNKTKYNLEERTNEINLELKNKTNQLLKLNKINNDNEKKINDKKILLTEIENNYNIVKNKYDLLNIQTDINNKKFITDIYILQTKINHLNKLNNEKDLIISNLRNENKLLKNEIKNITYNLNKIENEYKLNNVNDNKNKEIILEKDTENKKLEIKYDTIINDYKANEEKYLFEIKNLKNKIYEEENKNINLNNEIKEKNELNQKLFFDFQKIVEENYVLKNKYNEKVNIIKKYKDKEIKLNKEKEIVKDNIDYIEKSKIYAENERKFLIEEKEDLKNINEQLINEKSILLSDLQNKDLLIQKYENDIYSIDTNIENIKNKMKKIENISFLTKGFQLYLSQRFNKKVNNTENIFLYLTSSEMEIENLIHNLKIQEDFKNRKDKEILNLKTELENYQKFENKLKTIYSDNSRDYIELKNDYDTVNQLLDKEKEYNYNLKEIIKQKEFIISEACIKNEIVEKINNFYKYIIMIIFEEISKNLRKFSENELVFLLIQQFFTEFEKFDVFQNNIICQRNTNYINSELLEDKINNNKQKLINIINSIKEQIIIH